MGSTLRKQEWMVNKCFSRYTDYSFLQLLNHYTKWLWGKCEGVDPNRNFGYHWGEVKEGGASLDPCHETYAGPRAFSEPETKAMADYILANKKDIRYIGWIWRSIQISRLISENGMMDKIKFFKDLSDVALLFANVARAVGIHVFETVRLHGIDERS